MAEDTPVKEPETTVDWEKRYKDEQVMISQLSTEKKDLTEELSKSKQTLEAVQPYINWDAATGAPQETPDLDPEGLDKKINKMRADLSDEIAWSTFQSQNPDLKDHSQLVLSYVQKCTGTRDERLTKAKELTVKYITSLRDEGRKLATDQKDETARIEAEAGGLTPSATPPSDEKPVNKEESNNNYIGARQLAANKARGFF
jgi:hypothetical protein